MKLSICIPVFNFDVRDLVYDLRKEIQSNKIDAEIILIDDASDEAFININKTLQDAVEEFIFLEKNIGRAAIRNLFLTKCKGDFMLFLDCDVRISDENFLKKYLENINQNQTDVLYGGFFPEQEFKNTLRNRYSLKREVTSDFGSADYLHFKTVNFVIRQSVFEKIQFDESLKQYGYEDFFFAKNLKKKKASFRVVDNPVIHQDHSSNAYFLQKTEKGLETLAQLSKKKEYDDTLLQIKVYRVANSLSKSMISNLFMIVFSLLEPVIKSNLLSQYPQIIFFDIYRLGILVRHLTQKNLPVS